MFQGFAKVWSAVTLSRNVRRKPFSVVLAGERVALFRDGAGKLGALIDRCPHRGVRLSLGTVTTEGCLQCPFHGWEFNASGEACHVPLNPSSRRELLGVPALPVREHGGVIFVFTAPTADPPPLVLPEGMLRDDVARTHLQTDWACHWTRAMENMLDMPHVPYVHRQTIGRAMRPRIRRDSAMEVTWEETASGARIRSALDGNDGGGWLEFYKPNVMELHIDPPGKFFRMHAFCIPADENRTRMIIVGARDFMTTAIFSPLFAWSNARIVHEDAAVVQSSFPVEVPDGGVERSVPTDRATLQFRKYYFHELRPSSASVTGRDGPRPSSGPVALRQVASRAE